MYIYNLLFVWVRIYKNYVTTGHFNEECVSECWTFYAVPTARVIFTAKTSFDVFNLSREQVCFQSWVIESMR